MRFTIRTRWMLLIGCLSVACASNATAASHLWSKRFGDADYQSLFSVASDVGGNAITAGTFSGTVDFGGGPLTSLGGNDAFVAKYDASGAHQWSRRFGQGGATATSVATDTEGNVYVTGYFMGTIDFGGGPLTSAGIYDVFLAKFDASGVHLWSKRFGDNKVQMGYAVATDTDDNVILLGNFYGSITLGGTTRTSQGFNDVFIVKFDPYGVYEWSDRFGDSNDQLGTSVTTDADDNVIIAGWYNGAIDLGGDILVSAGVGDIFVAKLDRDGTHQWSRRFGDANDQYCYSVATDAAKNVIVTGGYYGTVDFGGGPLASAGAGVDLYLVKFDAAGVHQWSRRFGDGSDQYGYGVATDASGAVFLTGYMDGTVDFGGGPLTTGGGIDAFVAKFNAAGAHQWSSRFGAGGSQTGQSIATNPSGDVIVGGVFDGSVDFGGGSLTSAGANDAFLAKFGETVTGVHDVHAAGDLALSAFPNPIESSTTIRYTLPSHGPATVEIYDVRGARVSTLVNETAGPGTHFAAWNRRADSGPGVYFARVTHPAGTRTYRMVVLR